MVTAAEIKVEKLGVLVTEKFRLFNAINAPFSYQFMVLIVSLFTKLMLVPKQNIESFINVEGSMWLITFIATV